MQKLSLKDKAKFEIAKQLAMNSERLAHSKITTIHPDIIFKYSSVNVFVGPKGKGKSLTSFGELVKLSHINSNIHLYVYVNKDGRIDDTFEALKPCISIPIIYVSIDDIEDYLEKLYYYKTVYDKIKSEHWEDKLEDEQIQDVLSALYLTDFSLPSLQEIIHFDDAAFLKMLSNKNSKIVKMTGETRHFKFIFNFCVQGITSIPLTIKEQMSTMIIYSGFMKQKLPTIYCQSGIKSIDYQEFKCIYNKLGEKDFIVVDCQAGTFQIIDDADLTPLINYYKINNIK